MKLKIKLLFIFPYVFLCPCSFTNNPGSVYVEWHSFTNHEGKNYYIDNNSLTSAANFEYYDTGRGSLISCTLHY